MSRILLRLLAPGLALALVLTACSPSGGTAAPKAGGTITVAITGDLAALDPAMAYDFTTNPVVNEITEGLLRFSPSGELIPNLAESVDNPDPLTFIYHLRKGVTFSDGTPMTADDVVFSLNRVRDPKTASSLAWMFGSVDTITKTDDATVTVKLKKPDAQWRYTVATTAGHVISKAYYEAHAANFGKPDGGLLGTGPFTFVSWKAGSEVVLAKNPTYWDIANGPYLDKAIFKIVPEAATRATGLKTGEIDATVNISVDLVPTIAALANVNLQGVEGFSDDWIALNTGRAPFNDLNARKALLHAFNAKDILDNIVKDAGVAADNIPVGPALWTYGKDAWAAYAKSGASYGYDVEKAQAALAASKSPKGFKATLVTDGDGLRSAVAQALQANAKAIGIDIAIEKVSDSELTSRQFSGKRDYDIILGGWGSDFPDPAANVAPFLHSANAGDGGSNFAVYVNKQVDALLDEQAGLADDNKRAELLIQALGLAAADAPYIFLDHPKVFFAANKKVSGYNLSAAWYWDSILRNVSVSQ